MYFPHWLNLKAQPITGETVSHVGTGMCIWPDSEPTKLTPNKSLGGEGASHLPPNPFTGQFKKRRALGFDVFIVIWSTGRSLVDPHLGGLQFQNSFSRDKERSALSLSVLQIHDIFDVDPDSDPQHCSLVLQTPSKSFRHYTLTKGVWGVKWYVKSIPRMCTLHRDLITLAFWPRACQHYFVYRRNFHWPHSGVYIVGYIAVASLVMYCIDANLRIVTKSLLHPFLYSLSFQNPNP